MIIVNRDINIELTPTEIAAAFCELDSDEMVDFFDAIGEITADWGKPLIFQLADVSLKATERARTVMNDIGAYSEKI